MAKAEIIRYSSLVPVIDGIPMSRVQTLGFTTDKTREPVSELGNTSVVQYIEQNPTVAISIDCNCIGSTDNVALMTDALIRRTLTAGAQRVGTAEPRTTGATAYRYFNQIVSTKSNSSNLLITEQNILNAYVGILVPVTEDGINVSRTMWVNRAALTGISISVDVNGNATENYTLQANNQTWFQGNIKHAKMYVFQNIEMATVKSGTQRAQNKQGPASQMFFAAHSAIPVGASVLALSVDNGIMYRYKGYGVHSAAVVAAAGTAMMTATAGRKFIWSTPAAGGALEVSTPWGLHGRKVTAIYAPLTGGQSSALWSNSKLVSTAGSRGALARQNVTIYYWNTLNTTSTAEGQALRLQNVGIEVSPSSEDLLELGAKQAYGVIRQTPIPVTVTMTANDSDLEFWTSLAGFSHSTTVITLDHFNQRNQLAIDFFKDDLKTVKLSRLSVVNMEVTGVRTNVSAGGNSTHEYTFLADNFSWIGTGNNPNA